MGAVVVYLLLTLEHESFESDRSDLVIRQTVVAVSVALPVLVELFVTLGAVVHFVLLATHTFSRRL